MTDLINQVLLPIVATMASIILPLIVAFLADRFHAWTGLEMEARHREALQSALANAAKIILAGASKQTGISYVYNSVPDAIRALKVDGEGHIEDLLQPHLAAGAARPQVTQ